MNDFFASLYEIVIGLYGDNLASYLYGFCSSDISGLYTKIGSIMVLVTIGITLLYYFIIADSKKYKFKYWFFFLMVAAMISAFIGYYLPSLDLNQGLVCPQYLYTTLDAFFFGIVNFLYSGVLFFFISFGLKFIGKPQARHTPF